MIPKVIHCFWAGGPKPKLAEKCIASWRKHAPGWEIREWDLEKIGVGERCRCRADLPTFLLNAVAARKWAMVSDWVRMWVLHEEGGVYFDLDVELVQPIGELPNGEWVAGEWTPSGQVSRNPGSGIALEKGSPIAAGMLKHYEKLDFDPNFRMMPWITARLEETIRSVGELRLLPPEVLSPIDNAGKMHRTEKTVGIHWYAMSWGSPKQKILQWLSWHGFRPAIDALLKVKHALERRRT